MIVHRIAVNNIGPFLSDWEVSLRPGVTVFLGEYEGAGARSNRAGKSWLAVDAPLYVLYGILRGGRVEDLPHRMVAGKEDAWAELEVESSDGKVWTLRRGRTSAGDPIRLLNSTHISEKDLETVVRDEIVGLSAEEFTLTMAAVQGDVHAFMKLTASEKRRVVAPWFKTDRWIPRADLAKRRMLKAQADLRALDSEASRLSELLDTAASLEELEREAMSDVEQRRQHVEEIVKSSERLKVELLRAQESRRERRAAEEEVARLERLLQSERREAEEKVSETAEAVSVSDVALRQARQRDEKVKDLEAKEESLRSMRSVVEEVVAGIRQAREELTKREAERTTLLTKYKELTETRTGSCPILREACDRVERDDSVLEGIKAEGLGHRRRIMSLTEDLKGLEWKLDMAKSDVKSTDEEVRELRTLRGKQTSAQCLADLGARKREADEALKALERVKLGRTELAKALHAAKVRVQGVKQVEVLASKDIDGELEEARDLLRTSEERLAECKASALEVKRAKTTLAELGNRRTSLRRELELTAWAAYAFGAAGIPSRELENAFASAESNMNRVLGILRTPLQVRFSPTRELKDWEPSCVGCGTPFEKGERTHLCRLCGAGRRRKRRDELRLEVLDGENETMWELDSGGGKVLLSLGVRLGLAALPGVSRRVHCETLLIDEPDGALDEPNRVALHSLLLAGLEDLGIRQTLLITHADVRRDFQNAVVVHRWEEEDRSGAWNDV